MGSRSIRDHSPVHAGGTNLLAKVPFLSKVLLNKVAGETCECELEIADRQERVDAILYYGESRERPE